MKKRFFLPIWIGLLFIVILGIYFLKIYNKPNQSKTNVKTKIVDVDEIVNHPEYFQGFMGVVGRVMNINESKSIFILGCEDACIKMPVRYKGEMPKSGSSITVFGEIKKQENEKFIFEARSLR